MCELPSFPLFVSDYLGKTHPHLTLEQHGTYLLLLMFSWQRPTCALPDDDRWLAKRLDIQLRTWRPLRKTVLEQFFKQDEKGEWFSQRLRKEREYVSKIRRKSSENSLKRWSVSKENNDLAENRHMHPTPPHPKEEEREDLFGAGKQAPASPAGRGSATTEFAEGPTSPPEASPSPSSESKKESKQEESKTARVPSRAARTDSDATVATSSDTAAGCGVPKRRRAKPAPPADTPESEEFWRAFPRHDGKQDFKFAFADALKKTTSTELIAAAKRYATSRTGEDPKWTLYASTWLNKERWTDEPAPANVIDQAGNCVTARQVNGHRLSAGSASSERKRQILREAGMLS